MIEKIENMKKVNFNISAVVLAGGFARRMGEVCHKTPKSMLKFNGYPFLVYLVSWLYKVGFGEIIISTGILSDVIEKTFSNIFWSSKGIRILKENSPLGTGGAIKFVGNECSYEDIFLCNGDTVIDIDLPQMFCIHKYINSQITTIVTLNENVPNQGAITVKNGIVVDFKEGELARAPYSQEDTFRGSSTGVYFLKKSLIEGLYPLRFSSMEKEILPYLVKERKVGGISNGKKFFFDYGTMKRFEFLKKNEWLLSSIYGDPILERNRYDS